MKLRLMAAGAALALVLGACSSKEETMNDTIREGLPDDSTIARIIDEQPTEVQVLDLPALGEWQLAEVRATGERPHAWVVGYPTSGDSRTVVLTGKPDRWSQVIEGAAVEDEAGAVAVARAWYDATRRTDELWYRAESVHEIDWQPVVDKEAVTRLQEKYRGILTAPTATADADGWTVTMWSVQQRDLVRHRLFVGADASVRDEAETVEQDMPVSEAV